MPVRILRLPEVVELTGRSPTSIWRGEKAGQFPRRRKLGANSVGWVSTEIEEWIKALPEADEVEAAAVS